MSKTIISLKFSRHSPKQGTRTIISLENQHFLKESLITDTLSVFVLAKSDFPSIKKNNDLFFDKGQKKDSQDLSRYLVHYKKRTHLSIKKVFTLEVFYSQPGNICNGIKKYLEKTTKNPDTNWVKTSILYVNDDVFAKLLKQVPNKTDANETLPPTQHHKIDTIYDDIKKRNKIEDESIESLKKYFIGNSSNAQRVRLEILVAANNELPVLILGETGCGKNVIAETIHKNSKRSTNAFITINCGAIVSTLFESEFFGWKKGAHESAKDNRPGMIMAANNGTLFFDEIGDLPLDQQVKLLDFLERGKIRSLGEDKNKSVNLRIIAATNRDLHAMVQNGQFRSDLLFRLLQSALIMAPALRDHVEDIAVLSSFLWKKKIVNDAKSNLPRNITYELEQYRWPGNVRELKSILSGLFSYFGKDNLTINHLNFIFQMRGQMRRPSSNEIPTTSNESHKTSCLRHLKKTEDCIKSIQVLLEPFWHEKYDSRDFHTTMTMSMPHRIQDLEKYTKQPLLFYNESTFAIINQVKGSLDYMYNLVTSKQLKESHLYARLKLQEPLASLLDGLACTKEEIVISG